MTRQVSDVDKEYRNAMGSKGMFNYFIIYPTLFLFTNIFDCAAPLGFVDSMDKTNYISASPESRST